MKIFIKILSIIIISCLIVLTFGGCHSSSPKDESLKIVASFSPVYALTLAVTDGAKNITVNCMTDTSTGCLHDYQLSTNNMKFLEKADLFVINGSGAETGFINKIYELYPNLKVIDSSENVSGLLTMPNNPSYTNSHTWMSIKNACVQAETICKQLSLLDPQNSELYNKNCYSFCEDAKQLLNDYHEKFSSVANKNIVLFDESFQYLTEEFGLNTIDIISFEHGSSLNPKDIEKITEKISKNNISVIITGKQYTNSVSDIIKTESNIPVLELDTMVTGEINFQSYITKTSDNLSKLFTLLS